MNEYIKEISPENFDEIISTNKPVLIDFHATWCGPCKMIAPVIDEIATELKDTAVICKLDIDVCPDIAQKHGVMSVPTLIVFKGGEPVEKVVGARPKQALVDMIQKHV